MKKFYFFFNVLLLFFLSDEPDLFGVVTHTLHNGGIKLFFLFYVQQSHQRSERSKKSNVNC